MSLRRTWPVHDGGFTLVELLLAIAISAIVLGAVSQVVIVFLKTSDQTTARLVESRDAQTTSAYFANDVAAIGTRDYTDPLAPVFKQSVEVGVANGGGLYPCGSTGTAAVRLASDDVTKTSVVATPAVTTVTRVAYTAMATGTKFELHRLVCKGSSTPTSDTVMARDLTVAPTIACDVSCTGSGANVPSTLTMTLISKDSQSELAPVTVSMTGQRRQT